MITGKTDWRYVITPSNLKELYYCDICQRPVAALMHRYVTNADGERSEQFRVSCQVCGTEGKVYLNKTVAVLSWSGGEHKKVLNPFPQREKPKRRSGVMKYE